MGQETARVAFVEAVALVQCFHSYILRPHVNPQIKAFIGYQEEWFSVGVSWVELFYDGH
jgi:hypothetical protein